MEIQEATRCFAALAQETRLEVFRLLVRHTPDGLAAGTIARTLGVAQNTMSTHLATMTHAGLLESTRQGRSVIYAIDRRGTRALLEFLLEDCCQGRPEDCVSLLDGVLPSRRAGTA